MASRRQTLLAQRDRLLRDIERAEEDFLLYDATLEAMASEVITKLERTRSKSWLTRYGNQLREINDEMLRRQARYNRRRANQNARLQLIELEIAKLDRRRKPARKPARRGRGEPPSVKRYLYRVSFSYTEASKGRDTVYVDVILRQVDYAPAPANVVRSVIYEILRHSRRPEGWVVELTTWWHDRTAAGDRSGKTRRSPVRSSTKWDEVKSFAAVIRSVLPEQATVDEVSASERGLIIGEEEVDE